MAVTTTAVLSARAAAPRLFRVGRAPAMALPLAFTLALAAIGLLPSVRSQPNLQLSILGASGALLVWAAALGVRARGRVFEIDIQLRPQHYLQACAQGSVLLYWGWYWRPTRSVLRLSPLSSAPTCFCGSSPTGSTCSSS